MDLQVFEFKGIMIVVLHKHKIARGKRVAFTYICCRKTLAQCCKLEDIK